MLSTLDIQKLLNQHGYGLKEDGLLGPMTRAAVVDFQAKNGLVDDGLIGPLTLAALRRPIKRNLKDLTNLSKIPLAFSKPINSTRSVAVTANRYGNLVTELSKQINVEPALCIAFLHVESGGNAKANDRMVFKPNNHTIISFCITT